MAVSLNLRDGLQAILLAAYPPKNGQELLNTLRISKSTIWVTAWMMRSKDYIAMQG